MPLHTTDRQSTRSRSPIRRSGHHPEMSRHRTRSRSPHRESRHRHGHRRSRSPQHRTIKLPFGARTLSKSDLTQYSSLFASYLDIHKRLDMHELEEREIKGRWKSFVGKWNRGDLDQSWYDPTTLQKAHYPGRKMPQQHSSPQHDQIAEAGNSLAQPALNESGSEDDGFGPSLPRDMGSRRPGPVIPSLDDLRVRDESRAEDRAYDIEDIRYERKKDRKVQKERLEELGPRADPGSRERQLEKKRETTSKLKGFGEEKEGGDVEIGDADLMGDDGGDAFKRRKMEMERKKTEREIQKEERLRAKAAEREARMAGYKAKEDKTMEYFKAIAKERFG